MKWATILIPLFTISLKVHQIRLQFDLIWYLIGAFGQIQMEENSYSTDLKHDTIIILVPNTSLLILIIYPV